MKPKFKMIVSVAKMPVRRRRNWVATVLDYRLYCLDGANKVASADWIEAEDDDAAIEMAKTRLDGHDCELWQSRRLVIRLSLR